MNLHFAAILPHTKIFGGVKRFFEIGNLLITKGHSFTVFTPDGEGPTWFPFKGAIEKLEYLNALSIDALFITEPDYLTLLQGSNAKIKIFYAVLERSYIKRVANNKSLIVLANSTRLYNYLGGESNQNLLKAIGGIDLEKFKYQERPRNNPFVVMVYGRFYRKKKGVKLVIKACERLYKKGLNIKLLLFDTPMDEASRKLVENFKCDLPFEFFVDYPVKDLQDLYYKADVFVSAERNAGWANTCAEAMASGVSLIATRSGTKDFLVNNETGLLVWRHSWFIQRAILKLYNSENLRDKFRKNARKQIEGFSWRALADKIERLIIDRTIGR
jgi:glycosyltransferase involved in cell wall biosynthesis